MLIMQTKRMRSLRPAHKMLTAHAYQVFMVPRFTVATLPSGVQLTDWQAGSPNQLEVDLVMKPSEESWHSLP